MFSNFHKDILQTTGGPTHIFQLMFNYYKRWEPKPRYLREESELSLLALHCGK